MASPNAPSGGEAGGGGLNSVSPLLGTNNAQRAIDALATEVTRLKNSLASVSTSLQNVVKNYGGRSASGNASTLGGGRPNGGGGGGTNTTNGAPTPNRPNAGGTQGAAYSSVLLGGGKGNGGGSTPPPATPLGGGKGNGGGGGFGGELRSYGRDVKASMKVQGPALLGRAAFDVAGALVATAVDKKPMFEASNTTAQLLARTSTMPWQDIRTSYSRNNYTATSQADADMGAAQLGRIGFSAGSGQWNTAVGYTKGVGLVDPTLNSATVSKAYADGGTGFSSNWLGARGIHTMNNKGQAQDPRSIALALNAKILGKDKITTAGQAALYTSQSGAAGMSIDAMLRSGAISQEQADTYRSELKNMATASANGHTAAEYKAAADKGDTKALKAMGIKTTDITDQKVLAAKKRNVDDNMAQGFSEGLHAATAALTEFQKILDKITGMPGVGRSIGFAGGVTSALATTAAGGLAGGIMGHFMATRAGAELAGRGVMAAGRLAGRGIRGAARMAGRVGGAAERGAVRAAGWLGRTLRGASRGASRAAGGASRAAGGARSGLSRAAGWFARHASGEAGAIRAGTLVGGMRALGRFAGHGFGTNDDTVVPPDGTLIDPATGKPIEVGPAKSGWQSFMDHFHHRSTATDGVSGGAAASSGAAAGSGGGGSKAGGKGAKAGAGGPTGAQAIAAAKRYLGVPYVWGGTTPKGFDCSGLMQYVFKSLGVSLPRTSQEQAKAGSAVKITDVRPGDLVFPSNPTHVALFIGGGKVLEAPHTGANVRIAPMGSRFGFARRVLGSVGDVGAVTGDVGASVSGDTTKLSDMPALGGNSGGGLAAITGTSESSLVASALSGITSSLGNSDGSKQGSDTSASTDANGSGGPTGPMPSGSVGSWIKKALGILHLDYNKYGSALNTIIQHESSGNPRAINKSDSNWKAGHPSKGIMQTIDSTFRANMLPGHGDIWNPVDNIIAATRYALSRYGSMDNVPGIKSLNNGGGYKGYAVGSTNIDVDQIAKVHKGETILDASTAEQFRQALSQNTPTKGLLGGKGGGVVLQFNAGSVVLNASGPMNDSQATDFAKKFVGILANTSELKQIANG